MNLHQRHRLLIAASVTLLSALGACGPAGRDSTAQPESAIAQSGRARPGGAVEEARAVGAAAAEKVDDTVITAHVKAAIAADRQLSDVKIDVDTQDSVVTLSGLAPTATAKEHAAEIARTIRGVESVNNQLTIRS